MSLTRRWFLSACLALGVAPAVVKASSIMRVRPVIVPGDAEWVLGPTEGPYYPTELFTGEIGRYEGITIMEPGVSIDDIRRMREHARKHHIKPDADGCYIAMVTPDWTRDLRG